MLALGRNTEPEAGYQELHDGHRLDDQTEVEGAANVRAENQTGTAGKAGHRADDIGGERRRGCTEKYGFGKAESQSLEAAHRFGLAGCKDLQVVGDRHGNGDVGPAGFIRYAPADFHAGGVSDGAVNRGAFRGVA